MSANLHNEDRVRQLLDISTAFLCTDNDTIAGMAFLVSRGNPTPIYPADWCYVRMVGVHPLYRGNGISKALMRQCIQAARESGARTIGLHTSEIMNDARHIYEGLGFKVARELDKVFDLRYWLFRLDL